MALIRANTSGGGGGSLDYQYSGAGNNPSSNTITVDHNADKFIVVTDMIPAYKNQIVVKINGTAFPLSNASTSWDSGINYSGMGLNYYVCSATINSGDVISLTTTGTTVGAVIVIV